jgi:hypothetical protein
MGDSVVWDSRAPHRSRPPKATPVATGEIRILPVTDQSDGQLVNRGYAYWSQCWISGTAIEVFAGHADGQVRFFSVERSTGVVTRLGSPVSYGGTGEGWYWDDEGWVYLCDGPRLRRVNPFTGDDQVVFDISDTHPSCDIWQSHSSDDGRVHSATVRQVVSDGAYPKIGTIVKRNGGVDYFPAQGVLDESQISRDGRWLLIKEDHDNRIINLETGRARVITDADGALGHSDCGPDFAVGENNQIGACVYLDFGTLQQRTLFRTDNMGYVSTRGGRCLHSGETHLSLVALDGSGVITQLVPHGGGSGYDARVKAALSPCGTVATYMADGVVNLLLLP